MKIEQMKQLRAVSRSVKVWNLLDETAALGLVEGHVKKIVEYSDSHWVMVFEVMHNNTPYCIMYKGDKGHRMSCGIDWVLIDVFSLKTGKQMRKKDAKIMLDELYIRGQVKTFDTSELVCNYKTPSKYSSFASLDYNGKLYYLVRSATGLVLVVNSKGHALFVADTIKEAKIGIKQTCINQNK